MTTPPPPGSTPDEPTPDQAQTPAEAAPQLDSFAAEPTPEVPETAAPEAGAPEAEAPEAGAPEAGAAEAESPEVDASPAPDAPAPEVQPGPVEPPAPPTLADEEPAAPVAPGADIEEPQPPVTQPVAPEPVSSEPVSSEPVSSEPVSSEPVSSEPDVPVPAPVPAATRSAYTDQPTVTALDDPDRPSASEEGEPAEHARPGQAPPGQAPPGRARRSWLPIAAVATTVAVLAGVTGFLTWELAQREDDRSARVERLAQSETAGEQAREAALDAVPLLFSYNHSRLEQDFQKGLAVTTGDFREEYSRTTKEVVTPVAEQYDAVVVAEVIETAVISAEPDVVNVLVFLNQGTTSTRVQGQQVDQSRVRLHLVEADGKWLVEAVAAL